MSAAPKIHPAPEEPASPTSPGGAASSSSAGPPSPVKKVVDPRALKQLPQGPKPYPLIGNIPHLVPAITNNLIKMTKVYGPIFTVQLKGMVS
jgi:hypothetical protein